MAVAPYLGLEVHFSMITVPQTLAAGLLLAGLAGAFSATLGQSARTGGTPIQALDAPAVGANLAIAAAPAAIRADGAALPSGPGDRSALAAEEEDQMQYRRVLLLMLTRGPRPFALGR